MSAHPPESPSSECLEVLRHLWDLLDDQLDDEKTEELRRHIAACDSCSGYEAFQGSFLGALSTLRARYEAPPAVKARVLRSLRGVGFASG